MEDTPRHEAAPHARPKNGSAVKNVLVGAGALAIAYIAYEAGKNHGARMRGVQRPQIEVTNQETTEATRVAQEESVFYRVPKQVESVPQAYWDLISPEIRNQPGYGWIRHGSSATYGPVEIGDGVTVPVEKGRASDGARIFESRRVDETIVAPEQPVALMDIPTLRVEQETRETASEFLYPVCEEVDMHLLPQGHMFIPLENGKVKYLGPRNGQTNAEVRARC